MRTAIMQPYFLPYIGYFQLINSVDQFIVYDNIKYTKKGWINRNRILVNGKDDYITIPLKNDSDDLDVKDRYLAETWHEDKFKLINRIKEIYKKAPNFNEAYSVFSDVILFENQNLFKYIYNSLQIIKEYLQIQTPFIISSSLSDLDNNFKAEQKVVDICKKTDTNTYINAIGGLNLYSKETFVKENIDLKFLKSSVVPYQQFNHEFVPWLSILDVMMFNSKEQVINLLSQYELI